MSSLDGLVLNLLLKRPFGMANFTTKRVRAQLEKCELRERYWYIWLLVDEQDHLEADYLEGGEKAIFFENYLNLNSAFDDYSPLKEAFIFNSICSIFQSSPATLKKDFKIINRYINSIVSGVLREEREVSASSGYSDQPRYLGVCRLSKLVGRVCLSSGQGVDSLRLTDLAKNDGQVVSVLLR